MAAAAATYTLVNSPHGLNQFPINREIKWEVNHLACAWSTPNKLPPQGAPFRVLHKVKFSEEFLAINTWALTMETKTVGTISITHNTTYGFGMNVAMPNAQPLKTPVRLIVRNIAGDVKEVLESTGEGFIGVFSISEPIGQVEVSSLDEPIRVSQIVLRQTEKPLPSAPKKVTPQKIVVGELSTDSTPAADQKTSEVEQLRRELQNARNEIAALKKAAATVATATATAASVNEKPGTVSPFGGPEIDQA